MSPGLCRGALGGGRVAMTQSFWMRPPTASTALLLCLSAAPSLAQPVEPVVVAVEHPRLLLRPSRLRRLEREGERTSMRWEQFEALVAGKAAMPERGFAYALYYAISEDASFGRQAIEWAMGPDSDLRQQAIVFDWCQDLL